MARLRICDNRPVLWQWDTGIEVELYDCIAKELHFVCNSGIVKRTLTDGVCTIPDICLQTAGTLVCYAFCVDKNQRYTKHEFRLLVLARPKPVDYVDPASEETAIESIVTRLKSDTDFIALTKGEKGDTGYTPIRGKDYWTTADKNAIISAIDVTPKFEECDEVEFSDGSNNEYTSECDLTIGWVVLCNLPVDSKKSNLTFTVKTKKGITVCYFPVSGAYNYAYQRHCAFICTNTSGIWRSEFHSQDIINGAIQTSEYQLNSNDFLAEPRSAQDYPTCETITVSTNASNFINGTKFKFYTLRR